MVAQNEPPHQDLRCLQIQLFASLVVKELRGAYDMTILFMFKKALIMNSLILDSGSDRISI